MPALLLFLAAGCSETLPCESRHLTTLAEAECTYHYECFGGFIEGTDLTSCIELRAQVHVDYCQQVQFDECEPSPSREGTAQCTELLNNAECGAASCVLFEGMPGYTSDEVPVLYETNESCPWFQAE